MSTRALATVRRAFLFVIPLLCASPLESQVTGRTVDRTGNPVEAATVEFWTASARLGSAVTDAAGSFRFPAERSAGAEVVVVRRLGYETVHRAVVPGDTALRIVLTPAAVALPTLERQVLRHALAAAGRRGVRRPGPAAHAPAPVACSRHQA